MPLGREKPEANDPMALLQDWIRAKYERKEFAKMAMMRSMFGDEQYELLEKAAETKDDGGSGMDWELWTALTLALVSVGAVLGGLWYVFHRMRAADGGGAEAKSEL